MLSQAQTEKLIELVGDLLANDAQFAASMPLENVAKAVLRPGIGLAEMMELVAEGYADRPALAQRATEVVTVAGRRCRVALPRYESITYRELWERVLALVAVWHRSVRPGDRIATLGAPSTDYAVADMAVARLEGVSVPLHAGVPLQRLQPVVDETEPTVLASSVDHLEAAVSLCLASPSIRQLVVLDHDADVDDHRDALAAARERLAPVAGRMELETMATVLAQGRNLPVPARPASDPDRLAAIIYTSGSGGSPKGATQPDRLVSAAWVVLAATFVQRGFAPPAITLNYLPMSHTGGRAMLFSTIGAGGTAYFAGSTDLSTILEDLALVRPTQLNFIPRVWELLHAEYQRRVLTGEGHDTVLADMRTTVLGGRYLSALTGSAPISPDLAAWAEELLDGHLMDALGATESGGVIIDGKLNRPTVTDYRLDDVPELGYFSTDRPHPRGELLIKSTSLFTGYYRRDDLTAEVFDADGFYRTGDIVAEIGPDQLRYLDRRNNVIKLSQGEFVTISRLEALFAECEPVEQLYLYGNSERPYLLAVVVPTADAVAEHGDAVAAAVLGSFQDAASRSGLEPYEVPRDLIISPTAFTPQNGLMTATDKLARRELRDRFGDQLEALYAEHAKERDAEWHALVQRAPHQPVVRTVCDAAAAALGNLGRAPAPGDRYTDLGGDSLAAVSYASMLSDLLGVEVDVSLVISPANDLQAIADHIEALRRHDGAARPTFASVHGVGATQVSAADLTLDKFLDAHLLDAARSIPRPATEIRHVLLTGATGYLGRYLAIDWLQRMVAVGGTLTCLVRAKDEVAARRRLDAGFDTGDDDLLGLYRTLAADHLQVIVGDKAEPFLGLDEATWHRVADTVDLVVDPAALVNHALPYPQLFGPNVVGTAELIRLALTTRQKPIVHVSSVAAGLTARPGTFTEDADIRSMCPTMAVTDHYAGGYAASKWAGEVLLREAHDLCDVPVRIFRCDMLMAETHWTGQLNVPDMVTRLLFSVAVTGLAPSSFYLPDPEGGRARSHFDGLPVDFVADAISTIGSDLDADLRTYHVLNPHDDGIGLDEYVDWIAGIRPIDRIADHADWFRRFESALRNLPERQRHASLLPIIEAYRHPQPATPLAFATADRFADAVSSHGVAGGVIPGITPDIIEKYITDLGHLGLL